MRIFFLLILLTGFISSLEVEFSCPDEVYLNEDFECEIFLEKNKLSYDVKITIKSEDKIINKIWNGNSFSRADWYAEKLINTEQTFVRLTLDKEFYGIVEGEIKLRDSSTKKIIYSDSFKINIPKTEESILIEEKEIVLNSKGIKTERNIDLLDSKALKYSGLICLGLIAGVLYLIQGKNKNDRRNYKEDTFDINY
jgi:hypothetical protein